VLLGSVRPIRRSPAAFSTNARPFARRLLATVAALALGTGAALPARAARPLPDKGKWDRTFALYARDVSVPWKRITVRLDTYSGVPVDFAAYAVDPADVLVVGAAQARAVDTSRMRPVVRWRFTPPPGLRYTPNDVEVPLHNREGFFVIEARRGDAVQQTWLDLTRAGLLTKESPGGIVLYGADLGTGRALGGMRITYLVGTHFAYGKTDAHGIARWSGPQRPRFAIAEWGASKTFVSFLPQAPVPASVVGVRTERATVRAGERVHVIGFARKRVAGAYRPASGEAHVTILARGRTLAAGTAHLDAAGAFAADLALPPDAPAGNAAVLATAGGASGGAAIHVDAVADVVLSVLPACTDACPAQEPISIAVAARRADGTPSSGRDVRVQIVRSPHILPPGKTDDAAQWATTAIQDTHVRTDENGLARLTIPAPSDALASTYGIVATSGGSTASARIVAPSGRVALSVVPVRAQIDVSDVAEFDVRGFDAIDGRPAAGLPVRLRLVHGPTVEEQRLVLDGEGRAHAAFRNVVPGTNLAMAQADVDGKTTLDVSAVTVAPQALLGASTHGVEAHIATDKMRYRIGDRMTLDASLAGAVGDAFVSVDGARPMGEQTLPTRDGRVRAQVVVPETVGDASVGVAFVRDGALAYATQRIAVDGPGHARLTTLASDRKTYDPGAVAHVTIADGNERGSATLAIRLADQPGTNGSAFVEAPNVLAATGTTTQDPASDDPAWHGSVTPNRSTALDDGARSGLRTTSIPSLGAASERALLWRIERVDREGFDVTLPRDPGRYVVSVLKISDDGDVGAASLSFEVR
jgi:hypothetical protein